jgi:hypothetical protein
MNVEVKSHALEPRSERVGIRRHRNHGFSCS